MGRPGSARGARRSKNETKGRTRAALSRRGRGAQRAVRRRGRSRPCRPRGGLAFESGVLLGVVYDRNIKNQTVGQHMTRELITVDVTDPVSRVADLCIVHRVRRVPVMRNGRLVGVIARRDVLRALHQAEEAVCAV